MSESLLKKEFNTRDVERIRNLVKKDYGASTRVGVGYQQTQKRYREGDQWEEEGKVWTIKNGVKQNITKLDSAKQALHTPLTCPKCRGTLKHHLSKKMYKIHGVCFDCTIKYETGLKQAGLYEQYEKRMMQGNMNAFINDIEQWILDQIGTQAGFVTEAGDVEEWKSSKEATDRMLENVQTYVKQLRSFLT
jgi:ssDNA-binding Zn-finger/Zn-ribbon topoisomerase 1